MSKEYIVLGVALDWGRRKGLDVFLEIAKKLDDRFIIVLVGTTSEIDKILPNNILSIHRTQNQNELAEIYSAADVFVNPTREDNFPTVNLEALACGTPVITFNTGGSSEMLNKKCSTVIEPGNIELLIKEIIRICTDHPYKEDECCAQAQKYSKELRFSQYVKLYA